MADNGAGVFLSFHRVRLLAAACADTRSDWLPEIARGKTDIKQQTIFRTILVPGRSARSSLSALIMKNGKIDVNKTAERRRGLMPTF